MPLNGSLTLYFPEAEEGGPPISNGQPVDQERGWRNRKYGCGNRRTAEFDGGMGGEGREGLDRDQMAGEGGVALDDQHDGDEDI